MPVEHLQPTFFVLLSINIYNDLVYWFYQQVYQLEEVIVGAFTLTKKTVYTIKSETPSDQNPVVKWSLVENHFVWNTPLVIKLIQVKNPKMIKLPRKYGNKEGNLPRHTPWVARLRIDYAQAQHLLETYQYVRDTSKPDFYLVQKKQVRMDFHLLEMLAWG